MVRTAMKPYAPIALTLASLALYDCGGNVGDPTCSTSTFNVDGNTFVTFGTTADARKVDAFLQATLDLNAATVQIHDGITATCAAIGTDLGIAPSQYVAQSAGELPVAYTCRRVATEVRAILNAALPAGQALTLTITPPVCQVDLNVVAQCNARCTGSASATVPQCTGTVVVDCTGSCSGSCAGTCDATCTGTCDGTCTGRCGGTCTGQCSGQCDARDSTGRCIGTCMGTCTGRCSAMCTGGCTGSCSAGCSGSCRGECTGTCSVPGTVHCDGTFAAQADVQCSAACAAQANARATCTDPQVIIGTAVTVTPAALDRLNTLVTSLQRNYPRMLLNADRIRRVVQQSAPTFVQSLNGAGTAASHVGLTAVACFARAAVVSAEMANRFSVSAQVTVDFSATVSATATP